MRGFSRVDVSCVTNPKVDFKLSTGSVKVSSIPWLSKWTEKLITRDMFVGLLYPKSVPVFLPFGEIALQRLCGDLSVYGQKASHTQGVVQVRFKCNQPDTIEADQE